MGGGIVVNESWQREEQLFTDALARPRGERAAFVARACAGDERLRALVEKLLEEHEQADFLETPAAADLTDAARTEMADDGAALEVGTQIGRYRLREPIGEGGCGLVYRAEQAEPVRREVALKIIKLGLDTREVVGRFEAERQALAMMEHPNIARVFDGGATATGRPFFVMELVRGRKITEHCDAAKAPLQPRLRLFLQVCRAVQHAHQKGIIHRDLKPSNILVLELDGAPVVKVIDFGVAKAIEGRLAERTWWTRVEQFVGTPAYMSPEQAAGTRDDLDTRTDIYSLGVLLYELLVGCTPLDGVALRDLPGDEIRRRIRETEPPRPSVRFRGLEPPTQAQVAHGRGVEPKRLAAHVSGELEWIVMRCLEHDRARRYEAVSGLAEDLERHLAGEPVLARPPTTRYLARKFVGRHRVAFAVGGVVALSLIAGVTVATALYVRAAHAERDQARLRLRAELEAARSRQVVQFVGGMLQGVEPAVARGRDPAVVKDLLDDTVARLDDERELEPEIEADLRTLVGGIYLHIGQPTAAERMQRVALALRIASLGPTHPKVAESLDLLGDALSGQRLAVAAIVCHREALAIGEECFGRDAAEIMPTLLRLAETTVSNGRFADGRRYYERAQAIQRRHTAPDDPARARIAFDLARLTMFEGKAAEAEAQMRACLAAYRLPETRAQAVPPTIAPPPPWLLPLTRDEVWQTLSWALRDDQRYPEAEAAAREALRLQRGIGATDPDTLVILGRALILQDRHAEAVEPLEEALVVFRAGWAKEPSGWYRRSVGETLCLLGECFFRLGQHADAEAALREALPLHRGHVGLQANSLDPGYLLAPLLEKDGRLDEAEEVYRDALGWAPMRWNNDHAFGIFVGYHRLLLRRGKQEEAQAFWREQATMAERLHEAPDDPDRMPVRFAVTQLRAMLACGQADIAEAVARGHLAWRERRRDDALSAAAMRCLLGAALAAQGRNAEADSLLLSGSEGLSARGGKLPYWLEPVAREAARALEQIRAGESRLPGPAAGGL